MKRSKTIVFIDNSNVFQGQRGAGWRIDAKRLNQYLSKDGDLWQTFFFASVTDPPRYQQTNFYRFIKNEMRYEVSLFQLGKKSVSCKGCGAVRTVPVEKGVDVALATKLLSLANNRAFETAILVSADKDYLETVRSVRTLGLRVEVVAWKGTISSEMVNESSVPVVYFDDIRRDIEMIEGTDEDEEANELMSGEG